MGIFSQKETPSVTSEPATESLDVNGDITIGTTGSAPTGEGAAESFAPEQATENTDIATVQEASNIQAEEPQQEAQPEQNGDQQVDQTAEAAPQQTTEASSESQEQTQEEQTSDPASSQEAPTGDVTQNAEEQKVSEGGENQTSELATESIIQALNDNPELRQSVLDQYGATSELAARRQVSGKAYNLLTTNIPAGKLNRRADELRTSLRDVRLVQGLSQVAQDNNLSAPMVATFIAIPGFSQAVKNFPSVDSFNIVPEHPTSINSVAGMESFEVASNTASDSMRTRAQSVVVSFSDVLSGLSTTVVNLKAQLVDDMQALDTSDVTEEVLAGLPTYGLSDESFNEVLTKVETYLNAITPFNAESLQANPENVVQEIEGLKMVVNEIGEVLGVSMDEYGLREADRGSNYEPYQGTFANKGISGAGVNLIISRAGAVLDALERVADRKDDLVSALNIAIEATPAVLNTEDVTYGSLDHITLINSYVTFVTKLVSEAVQSVAMVLSMADSILDVDQGYAD